MGISVETYQSRNCGSLYFKLDQCHLHKVEFILYAKALTYEQDLFVNSSWRISLKNHSNLNF